MITGPIVSQIDDDHYPEMGFDQDFVDDNALFEPEQMARTHESGLIRSRDFEPTQRGLWHVVGDDQMFSLWHDDYHYTDIQAISLPKGSKPRQRKTGFVPRKPLIKALSTTLNSFSQRTEFSPEVTEICERVKELARIGRSLYSPELIARSRSVLRKIQHIFTEDPTILPFLGTFIDEVNGAVRPFAYEHSWMPGDLVMVSANILHYRVDVPGFTPPDSHIIARGFKTPRK